MSDEIAAHTSLYRFDRPMKLPDGDERPQPVRLMDAAGRTLVTLTANEFLRAHGRADEATDRPPQPFRHSFAIIRRCAVCGVRKGTGVCIRCSAAVHGPAKSAATGG